MLQLYQPSVPPLEVSTVVIGPRVYGLGLIALSEHDHVSLENLGHSTGIPETMNEVGTPKGLDRSKEAVILETYKVNRSSHKGVSSIALDTIRVVIQLQALFLVI